MNVAAGIDQDRGFGALGEAEPFLTECRLEGFGVVAGRPCRKCARAYRTWVYAGPLGLGPVLGRCRRARPLHGVESRLAHRGRDILAAFLDKGGHHGTVVRTRRQSRARLVLNDPADLFPPLEIVRHRIGRAVGADQAVDPMTVFPARLRVPLFAERGPLEVEFPFGQAPVPLPCRLVPVVAWRRVGVDVIERPGRPGMARQVGDLSNLLPDCRPDQTPRESQLRVLVELLRVG